MFDNDEYSFKPFDKEEYGEFEKQQADQARSSGSAGYAEIVDIDQLCELCSEYKGNETKIYLAKSRRDDGLKYPHLDWVVKQETEKLEKLNNRQNELKELIKKQFSA